jgi:hypothetical protein
MDAKTQLAEEVTLYVRQSSYIQHARVDAYLEGVILAAEQVQDKRIQFLETPPEVTGWEFVGNILLTFALESTIGGKLLAAITKRIFTPVLRQNAVFMAMPDWAKAPDGKALKKEAERLSRMNSATRITTFPSGRTGPIETGRSSSTATIAAVLKKGAGGRPGLSALGREDVKLYHDSLEAIIRGTPDTATNLAAAAKSVREALQGERPKPAPYLGASDSTGVSILGAAQSYASLTRLGIQFRHAWLEWLLKARDLEPASLTYVIDLCAYEALELEVDGQKIELDLSDIRGRYKMLFEAVIWARLFGFDKNRNQPRLQVSAEKFEGVDQAFSDYWTRRFGSAIDGRYMNARDGYRASFKDLSKREQLFFIQKYFWEIVTQLPRLKQNELTQR